MPLVTLNSTGVKRYAGPSTAQSYSETISGGAALTLALVFGHVNGVIPSSVAATWGGVALTKLVQVDNNNTSVVIFGLAPFTPGTQTVAISWTNSAEVYGHLASWDNADPTGGATTFPHTATATSATTASITSATGNKVVAAGSANANPITLTAPALFLDYTARTFLVTGWSANDAGAPTVGIGIASGATADAIAAIDIKAAGPPLSASNFALTQALTFGVPTVGTAGVVAPLGFQVGSPVIGAPTIGVLISGVGFAVGSPVLGSEVVRPWVAIGIAVGSPSLGIPPELSINPLIAPIIYTGDRHVRRSGDDYATAFANMLPRGAAWPREDDTVLMQLVYGLAQIWGFADSRAADLLETESDPRFTVELLPEWERAWGLPDPCQPLPQGFAARRNALVLKMTMLGAQSRQFFINVAASLGYTVTISEYLPYQCGISRCGDTRTGAINPDSPTEYMWQLGPPELRYYWTIHVGAKRITQAHTGSAECGVTRLLDIDIAKDLECLIDRWKPAHTQVVFDYSATGPPP